MVIEQCNNFLKFGLFIQGVGVLQIWSQKRKEIYGDCHYFYVWESNPAIEFVEIYGDQVLKDKTCASCCMNKEIQ